ncbi:MAG TPA: DUF2069 domain-containing protein [Burkholderiales bacterium]
MTAIFRRVAAAAYVALALVIIGWEIWIAPPAAAPRAYWLALKLAPLALPLPGLVRGSARAHVLAALLLLLYFCGGIAVAYDAAHRGALGAFAYGAAQTLAALAFVVAAAVYARLKSAAASPPDRAETES